MENCGVASVPVGENCVPLPTESPQPIIDTLPAALPEANQFVATPEIAQEWRKHYLREGHSVHSTTTYFNYIKRFVGFEGNEITQKSVDRFRSKNMSGAAAGSLKNFFQFLVNRKGFPQSTLYIHFDKSKSTKKFPKSIDPLEVQKLIEAMPTLMEKNLTFTSYELGLRISEVLKLTWADFSWTIWLQDKSQQGSVNLKNTKGDKFRTIPVPPELMAKLYNDHSNKTTAGIPIGNLVFDYGITDYLNNKEKSIEENKYDYIVVHAEDCYRKLLYKVSKQVLNKRINPHQLRHAKAQDMMNKGVPIETIKAFLGHARISSTEIYAKASAEKIKKDMEEYNKKK